jgi:L-malate glycosyltransferase
MTQKTVLHIASHMGGGVGKVLTGVASNSDDKYRHDIILLEKPIDTQFTDECIKNGVIVKFTPDMEYLLWAIKCADIVQVDWWGHPLMAKLLYDIRNEKIRLVIWAHTAGCYYPFIRPDFVTFPHHFIFSSLHSKDNPYWSLGDIASMTNTSVINSSGGFKDTRDVPLVKHDGFNVGYVGTLAYVKLLPEFIEYCKCISYLPGIKFIMIGRIPEPNLVLRDAEKAGIADQFVFKGYVPDLPAELAQLDMLGYLLNPQHFGTTENAMLEAMSMGIPPVCIDQCAEKYLVKNYETGFLIKDKSDYLTVTCALYNNPKYRHAMGKRAREHILTNLELENTIAKLNEVYDKVILEDKRIFDIEEVYGKYPRDWYKSGLPPGGIKNLSGHLQDSSKGSIKQWQKYFPGQI